VHVSVNLLNSYLPEIASNTLGRSKERVKKIESLLIEMTNWITLDEEVLPTSEEELFDAPYSLKVREIQNGKKKAMCEKQKLMRELRVIEAVVQILHIPFATKIFDFSQITQDSAITSICKLSYNLMSAIVQEYDLN
jgi:hypothetical protein